MSVQCNDSSHAYKEESPRGRPPHPRKYCQAPSESQRLQQALLQSQKLHQAPCQRLHLLVHWTISWFVLLPWSIDVLQTFILGLLHTQFKLNRIATQGRWVFAGYKYHWVWHCTIGSSIRNTTSYSFSGFPGSWVAQVQPMSDHQLQLCPSMTHFQKEWCTQSITNFASRS